MNRARKLLISAVVLGICALNASSSGKETVDPAPVDPAPVDPAPVDPAPVDPAPYLKQQTVSQLKQRLAYIDEELGGLAQYSLRSGVGAIGYRSATHQDAAHTEWIQIDLENESTIDEVVLVPCILRDTVTGFTADAFPLEFRVLTGVGPDDEGTMITSFDADDRLLPRIAPLVVNCDGIKATWVRIEATLLSPRQFDGKHLLQFAEILVFRGTENVALGQPLQTSSNEPSGSPAWDASFAVDGFMPYLMNGATGYHSLAYVSAVGIGDEPSITIDLETVQPLSQVNLHLVDQSDTVPQTFMGDFGLPRLLRIEGANRPDFSDVKLLDEFHHASAFDAGPIIMRRFPETGCRHVRLTAIDPYIFEYQELSGSRIGFAEIELISAGENVALGKQAQAVFEPDHPDRSLATLTDGHNFYGLILPVRKWVAQLARRHDLETLRPLVAAELNARYLRQSTNLKRMIWLAAILAAGALSAVVIGWSLRQRAVFTTRERIAADLHDELSANVHAIGLLSDLVQTNSESPEKLKPLLARMRDLTERTGTAATYCANMLESKGLYDDLVQDMRRSSARIMADLDHEITFDGVEHLDVLNPRKRIDLFLFHKECLINIIRHSGATRVTTRLIADPDRVCLDITDDGTGLDASTTEVPPSLKRRARLLGGFASVKKPAAGGTHVALRLPLRRFGILNWLRIMRGTES